MIRGTLTCGGSGLSGKTITLTSSKLSYVGTLGTVVTGEDGSFSKSYKPASTAKPLSTVSAWFLGGPDEGGIASKVVTPQGGPQTSNTANTPQGASNNGNGATSQQSSNTGNGQSPVFTPNSPTSTQQSSNTGNGATSQESSNTGNGRTNTFVLNPPTSSQESSNTGNAAQGASNNGNTADIVNTVLAVHNRERAAVGVPDLAWSDQLAAGAKTWAEHLATTGQFAHDPNIVNVGENIAGFNPSKGISAPGEGLSLWVTEKNNYHGGPASLVAPVTGHYTQMVWKNTKEVGCGTASGGGHPYSILVCRYSPPGNYRGQAPY